MSEDLKNVIYHHDNAPAHMAAAAVDLKIALLRFHRLSHPPYSPALAPLDFAHFPMLKSNLRGHMFNLLYKPFTDPSVVIGSKMCSNNGFEGTGSVWNTQTDNLKSCANVTLQVRVDILVGRMFVKFGSFVHYFTVSYEMSLVCPKQIPNKYTLN